MSDLLLSSSSKTHVPFLLSMTVNEAENGGLQNLFIEAYGQKSTREEEYHYKSTIQKTTTAINKNTSQKQNDNMRDKHSSCH
jgi:hypothetical protein